MYRILLPVGLQLRQLLDTLKMLQLILIAMTGQILSAEPWRRALAEFKFNSAEMREFSLFVPNWHQIVAQNLTALFKLHFTVQRLMAYPFSFSLQASLLSKCNRWSASMRDSFTLVSYIYVYADITTPAPVMHIYSSS